MKNTVISCVSQHWYYSQLHSNDVTRYLQWTFRDSVLSYKDICIAQIHKATNALLPAIVKE